MSKKIEKDPQLFDTVVTPKKKKETNQEKSNRRRELFLAALNKNGVNEIPKEEYVFHDTRKWRFDFAFLSCKLAVELDGGTWGKFGGRHNGDGDRDKLNQAAVYGWRVMRFSGPQIEKDPDGCALLVKGALDNSTINGTIKPS